jgi:hypothetical protein
MPAATNAAKTERKDTWIWKSKMVQKEARLRISQAILHRGSVASLCSVASASPGTIQPSCSPARRPANADDAPRSEHAQLLLCRSFRFQYRPIRAENQLAQRAGSRLTECEQAGLLTVLGALLHYSIRPVTYLPIRSTLPGSTVCERGFYSCLPGRLLTPRARGRRLRHGSESPADGLLERLRQWTPADGQ